ncbi:MAG TPA: class II fructose-bisphosphate aldolase [Spirochaetia bacterium]|nr:class II fructose-bisphosphate aldolase [Spirochaetia bacterium]
MPLVTDCRAVKDLYQDAAERGIALPVFCAEDRETLEAILAAALEMGKEIGVEDLPIIPAWTCRYPPRGQMTLLTACGDPVLGTRLMFSDLEAFAGDTSPYRKLRIMPHLDHAFPWLDGDILVQFADRFASVMCDASERPFAENIELTARYVEQVKGRVVVEGAVDEIYSAEGAEKNELTSVEKAREFLRQTGVDLLVPNVGTEHRATAKQVSYAAEQARKISAAVGRILCLHGTSSVNTDHVSRLPGDGFVKINIYTTLAVHGGQALAREVLGNIGNIFRQEDVAAMVREGILGDRVLEAGFGQTVAPIGPKLTMVANPPRRDAWFEAVKQRCLFYIRLLNYGKWKP